MNGQSRHTEGVIMNGQSRHTGNNRHKTQSKDKQYKHITQKTEKMSNNHHTKNRY
jgi:hypothetical protein